MIQNHFKYAINLSSRNPNWINSLKKVEISYVGCPIVIEDYNSAFMWHVFKYTGIPLMIGIYLITPYFTGEPAHISYASLLVITMPLYNMYKRSQQRKIVLSQNKIEYIDADDKLSIIDMNLPNSLKKSYQNYYHKTQDLSVLYFIFIFFFVSLLMKSLVNGLLFLIGAFVVMSILNLVTKYIVMGYLMNLRLRL